MDNELEPQLPAVAFEYDDPREEVESLEQCGRRLWQGGVFKGDERLRYDNFITTLEDYHSKTLDGERLSRAQEILRKHISVSRCSGLITGALSYS